MSATKTGIVGTRYNWAYIKRYIDFMSGQGRKPATLIKFLYGLSDLTKRMPKNFKKATRQDIISVLAEIERSDLPPFSKQLKKQTIKQFYEWMHDNEGYKDNVRLWMKVKMPKARPKFSHQMLNTDDIDRMLLNTSSLREKCFIACLWSLGCRPSEILSTTKQDFLYENGRYKVRVDGKTGQRIIPILEQNTTEYLNEYLPKVETYNSYVFPMSYAYVRKRIEIIARRANVNKRIYLYLWRHSKATYLAKYLKEYQLKLFMGHSPMSRATAVYVHLSGADLEDAMLAIPRPTKKSTFDV